MHWSGSNGGVGAQTVILKSETYNFHRLDLTRQAGFIVTIYDEDGLRLAATMPFPTCPFWKSDPDVLMMQTGATEG
jgi:hypothetical protein